MIIWSGLRKMPKLQILSYEQAKRFYDWMGAKQDTQCFYEGPALSDLVAHLELARAEKVIEFGCGTGRLAEELFNRYLPPNACYVGLDLSSTMIELAQSRTARFEGRAEIQQTSGTMRVDLPDAAFDRFISTYVLDLLSEKDIDSLLSEAYRVLANRGLLGLVSLTRGSGGLSRFVTWTWQRLNQFSPMLMGGCRPITIRPLLEGLRWRVRHRNVVTPFAVASEIVVAEKITLLCDLRRNAISRKYGFSGSTLSEACSQVGILYVHLPGLGIASSERQSLSKKEDYVALFSVYRKESLPKHEAELDQIQCWILSEKQRVALTCFEREPDDCHRHCVAEAIAKRAKRAGVELTAPHLP